MSEQTLAEFVELEFIPARMDRSADYRRQCRRAAKRFADFLQRDALLTDLNRETVIEFREWLNANETPTMAQKYRICLKTVWRYAHEIGKAGRVRRLTVNNRYYQPKGRAKKRIIEPATFPEGSVRHFLETVYIPQKLIDASEVGIDHYRRSVRQLSEFIGHEVMLTELSDELAARFFRSLIVKGRKAVSVNGTRGNLFAVWRYACKRGKVDKPPMIDKLPEARDEPDAWSEDELRALLTALDTLDDRPPLNGYPIPGLLRAVILTAWWTALRRGTLFKLRAKDLDLAGRWVTVPGTSMKNRRGKRFRIGDDAADALRTMLRYGDGDRVFPKMTNTDWRRFYAEFDRMLEAAKIAPSRRDSMTKTHKIRRSTATSMAMRRGVHAATALLGQSGQEVTMRYIDPSKLPGNDVTDVLPSLTAPAPLTAAEPDEADRALLAKLRKLIEEQGGVE